MANIYESKAVLLPNNIDTDQIYPGRYLAIVEPQEIAKYVMTGIEEQELVPLVPGSIVVAGTNFGCGSSREHAVIALMNANVKAVVAESFARIFFRNAINLGLPLLVCKDISSHVKTGDALSVNIDEGTITNESTGQVFQGEKMGEHILNIIAAGGIKNMMKDKYK